jgi:hypothetical protein
MVKTKSKKQEEKWAKSMKGKAIPGSGNQDCWKGDVDSGREVLENDWKMECKTTKNGYYKLTLKDLEKVATQAEKVGRNPVFTIKYNDDNFLMENEFCIIPQELFDNARMPHLGESIYAIIIKGGKSVKLTQELLEMCWLEDKLPYLEFNGKEYVILNELDFKKMVGVI